MQHQEELPGNLKTLLVQLSMSYYRDDLSSTLKEAFGLRKNDITWMLEQIHLPENTRAIVQLSQHTNDSTSSKIHSHIAHYIKDTRKDLHLNFSVLYDLEQSSYTILVRPLNDTNVEKTQKRPKKIGGEKIVTDHVAIHLDEKSTLQFSPVVSYKSRSNPAYQFTDNEIISLTKQGGLCLQTVTSNTPTSRNNNYRVIDIHKGTDVTQNLALLNIASAHSFMGYIASFMDQVGTQIHALHKSGLVHGDVKLLNICVKKKADSWHFSLIDLPPSDQKVQPFLLGDRFGRIMKTPGTSSPYPSLDIFKSNEKIILILKFCEYNYKEINEILYNLQLTEPKYSHALDYYGYLYCLYQQVHCFSLGVQNEEVDRTVKIFRRFIRERLDKLFDKIILGKKKTPQTSSWPDYLTVSHLRKRFFEKIMAKKPSGFTYRARPSRNLELHLNTQRNLSGPNKTTEQILFRDIAKHLHTRFYQSTWNWAREITNPKKQHAINKSYKILEKLASFGIYMSAKDSQDLKKLFSLIDTYQLLPQESSLKSSYRILRQQFKNLDILQQLLSGHLPFDITSKATLEQTTANILTIQGALKDLRKYTHDHGFSVDEYTRIQAAIIEHCILPISDNFSCGKLTLPVASDSPIIDFSSEAKLLTFEQIFSELMASPMAKDNKKIFTSCQNMQQRVQAFLQIYRFFRKHSNNAIKMTNALSSDNITDLSHAVAILSEKSSFPGLESSVVLDANVKLRKILESAQPKSTSFILPSTFKREGNR